MSDEITLTLTATLTNVNLRRSKSVSNRKATQTTKGVVAGLQNVGFAAHEALVMGDVSAAGFAYFENHGPTNFVQIGSDVAGTFVPFLKLKAGEAPQFVRLATNAPYAKADTAAVDLEYEIWRD